MLVAVLLVSACGETFTPDTACPREADVDLQVSDGLRPEFTWSPPCGVRELIVWDLDRDLGSMIWELDDLTERIPPGVRFGEVPPGVEELERRADSLEAGRRYRIWVSSGPSNMALRIVGTLDFER